MPISSPYDGTPSGREIRDQQGQTSTKSSAGVGKTLGKCAHTEPEGTIRDGDVVKVRVSGEVPEIVENHALDSNVACPES